MTPIVTKRDIFLNAITAGHNEANTMELNKYRFFWKIKSAAWPKSPRSWEKPHLYSGPFPGRHYGFSASCGSLSITMNRPRRF